MACETKCSILWIKYRGSNKRDIGDFPLLVSSSFSLCFNHCWAVGHQQGHFGALGNSCLFTALTFCTYVGHGKDGNPNGFQNKSLHFPPYFCHRSNHTLHSKFGLAGSHDAGKDPAHATQKQGLSFQSQITNPTTCNPWILLAWAWQRFLKKIKIK